MKGAFTGAGLLVVGLVLVAVIGVGGYLGYWWLAKDTTARRYDVNTGTQQYQAGLISQERNLSLDWNKAVDPSQKQAIADQFCAVYQNLTPPPADLATAHATIC